MNPFDKLIQYIESTDFYIKYVSKFPAPLNNVAFDLILILAILAIIFIPWFVEIARSHAVRRRVHKRAERVNEERKIEKEQAEIEKKQEKEERLKERAEERKAREEERAVRKAELNAFNELAKSEKKKAAVSDGTLHPFRISTRSMEPALKMNTTAYARPCSAEDVEIGDVVAYRFDMPHGGSVYVIHRIVEITEDGNYILRGDNETKNDPPVKPEQIEFFVDTPRVKPAQ